MLRIFQGFTFTWPHHIELVRLINASYSWPLGVTRAWQAKTPGFMADFSKVHLGGRTTRQRHIGRGGLRLRSRWQHRFHWEMAVVGVICRGDCDRVGFFPTQQNTPPPPMKCPTNLILPPINSTHTIPPNLVKTVEIHRIWKEYHHLPTTWSWDVLSPTWLQSESLPVKQCYTSTYIGHNPSYPVPVYKAIFLTIRGPSCLSVNHTWLIRILAISGYPNSSGRIPTSSGIRWCKFRNWWTRQSQQLTASYKYGWRKGTNIIRS